jgi:hypothetical protein
MYIHIHTYTYTIYVYVSIYLSIYLSIYIYIQVADRQRAVRATILLGELVSGALSAAHRAASERNRAGTNVLALLVQTYKY